LQGYDGSSLITALTLDMSDAGAATFNAGAIFNESGADSDFRVESNGNANMLFVDAGNDGVGIGTNNAGNSTLEVRSTGVDGTFANAIGFQYSGNSSEANTISTSVSSNAALSGMKFNISDGGGSSGKTNVATFLRNQIIFNDDSNDQDFRIESDNNTNTFTVDASLDACLFGKNNGDLTTTGAAISAVGTASFAFNLTSENETFILNNNNATGATYKMDFRQNNSSKGSIAVGSSSTAYNTSSDYRLKENVETLKDGLSRLAQLKPVQFTWTTDGALSEGFIAHEVDEVFPDAVTGEKDAVDEEGNIAAQQMDYGRITPLLVKAIQEQQEQIEELKAEIATLKGG